MSRDEVRIRFDSIINFLEFVILSSSRLKAGAGVLRPLEGAAHVGGTNPKQHSEESIAVINLDALSQAPSRHTV